MPSLIFDMVQEGMRSTTFLLLAHARVTFYIAAICILLSLCVMFPQPVVAWSASGHADIAEQVFQRLSPSQQRYFAAYSDALRRNEPSDSWRRDLKGYSSFAQMAVWPDTRRDPTLDRLFYRFAKEPVPASLIRYRAFNTSNWHYVNQYYWDKSRQKLFEVNAHSARCKLKPKGYLAVVWPDLIEAFTQAQSPAAKGLVLALIAHLLADAFQPLHAMAAVDQNCKPDAGGNQHCLVESGNRCKLNLHQLWDRGFDVFEQRFEATKSDAIFADAMFESSNTLEPILQASSRYARFIYSQPEQQKPSRHYQQQSEAIVLQQRAAAIAALSALLDQLYSAEFPNSSVSHSSINSGGQSHDAAHGLSERIVQWWQNMASWFEAN